MASVLSEIIIDCEDAERLARFWSEVLGWPLTQDPDGEWWISSTGELWGPTPILLFTRVSEPKTVKNRLHLDLNPSGCDQTEELERLLSLGAQRIDIGQGEVSWVVLADPEGNEFCLLASRRDK
jgi:predicted enzyme related to lactoylglutathione lyase